MPEGEPVKLVHGHQREGGVCVCEEEGGGDLLAFVLADPFSGRG